MTVTTILPAFVDIGACRSQSDGGIFRNSIFGKALEENKLAISPSVEIVNINTNMPFFFAADEAFPLKQKAFPVSESPVCIVSYKYIGYLILKRVSCIAKKVLRN